VSPALLFLAIVVLLQSGDVATTAYGLRHGLAEANPLASRLFGALGPLPAAIALKLVLTAPLAAFSFAYPDWWPVPAIYAASLVWVVRHNLKTIRSSETG
jgi:hypothetical protein